MARKDKIKDKIKKDKRFKDKIKDKIKKDKIKKDKRFKDKTPEEQDDIADFTNIHASYGTRRDFRAFVREAHRRGLRSHRVWSERVMFVWRTNRPRLMPIFRSI